MTQPPTKTQVALARAVLILSIAAVVFGLLVHGVSAEVLARMWHHMLDRSDGPFVFRFVLQPLMATLAALRGGIHDARIGRAPFLLSVLTDPAQRRARLDEALIATSRIVLLGLAIDGVYQFIEFDTVFPVEALVIALLLGVLPYVVLRGLVTRIARHWVGKPDASRTP